MPFIVVVRFGFRGEFLRNHLHTQHTFNDRTNINENSSESNSLETSRSDCFWSFLVNCPRTTYVCVCIKRYKLSTCTDQTTNVSRMWYNCSFSFRIGDRRIFCIGWLCDSHTSFPTGPDRRKVCILFMFRIC